MKSTSNYEKEADYEGHINIIVFRGDRNRPTKRLHFHDSLEFAVIERGACGMRVGSEERVLRAGEIGFANRFCPHSYNASFDAEGYIVVVSAQYLSLWDGQNKAFPTFMDSVPEAFGRILNLLEQTAADWLEANALMKQGFVNMFIGLLARYYPVERYEREKGTATMIKVMEYIDAHFAEPINLQVLSETFGYTQSYLSSAFNKFAGMNLREYINRRRIGEVVKMKRDADRLPIYKIAALCGFDSANTFYRAYERYADDGQSQD